MEGSDFLEGMKVACDVPAHGRRTTLAWTLRNKSVAGRTRLIVSEHQSDVDGQRATSKADRDEPQDVLLPYEHNDVHLR